MFETTNQVRDWKTITAHTRFFFWIIHHNSPTQQGQIWESYPNPSALNARFSYNYLHWIAYHIYPYIRSMKGLSQWIRHPWTPWVPGMVMIGKIIGYYWITCMGNHRITWIKNHGNHLSCQTIVIGYDWILEIIMWVIVGQMPACSWWSVGCKLHWSNPIKLPMNHGQILQWHTAAYHL